MSPQKECLPRRPKNWVDIRKIKERRKRISMIIIEHDMAVIERSLIASMSLIREENCRRALFVGVKIRPS
jgi:hypothetical protein